MTVQVVTPFRSMEPQRVKLADWCRRRWEAFGYEVRYCDDGLDVADPSAFGRSRAVNLGVASVDAEYVIVADADIIPQHWQADEMVNLLGLGAPWVIGYDTFRQLDRYLTERIISRDPGRHIDHDPVKSHTRWQSPDSVCGLWAMRRDDFLSFDGFDERMRGWGGEDVAFAACADTLIGPAQRLAATDCLHGWHPQRADRKTDSWATANAELEARYLAAAGDPETMTALRREDLNQRAWK